jgi:cation:H+ antiporter
VSGSPVWLLVAMFVGAGAAIWAAGIEQSDQTDVLTMRLGLGSALGGLILLAIPGRGDDGDLGQVGSGR